MTFSFSNLSAHVRLADVFDVAIITVFFYLVLLWLKQRASYAAAMGTILLACLYVLAQLWDMYLTSRLFQAGLTVILVAIVLIFQEDLRRTFEHLTLREFFGARRRTATTAPLIDTLVETLASLATHHIGALIVLQGREALSRHIRGGIVLNGHISMPLLCSIFHPQSPGHDGAVLIEGNLISKFGVHLPLSNNLREVGAAGTRHTAALGLAERTDALVLVVSEERGAISVAEGVKLDHLTALAELKERLEQFCQQVFPDLVETHKTPRLTRNLGSKLTALCLASALWLLFAYRVETIQRTFVVPIEYRNLPTEWALEERMPTRAQVTLSGIERAFDFDPGTLTISLDVSKIQEGVRKVFSTAERLNKPPGLVVNQIEPRVVKLQVRRMVSLSLPVQIRLEGNVPKHLKLLSVESQPETIRVRIRQSDQDKVAKVSTELFNLEEVSRSIVVQLPLILPDNAQLVSGQASSIRVTINVTEKESPSP